MKIPARWLAIGLFVFSSALNYLARNLLPALAEPIRGEFNWSYTEYALLGSYFAFVYALSAPLMGLLIDRIGLTRGVTLAVGGWSLATIGTGISSGVTALISSRLALGVTQAGGIPASGKAMATYLEPSERALGNSLSQAGISIGSIAAPLLAAAIAPDHGWRAAFWVAGLLGFVWIPLWWLTARTAPVQPVSASETRTELGAMLRSVTYWGLVIATMLGMTVYSLWANFTTIYFVRTFGLESAVANRAYSWIPPLIGGFGGITGGLLSLRLIRNGGKPASTRRLVTLAGAILVAFTTALAPLASTPLLAALLIGISNFSAALLSVNLYALPIDIFGRERAAFNIASLTCAFGLMYFFFSIWIGRMLDTQQGFQPICWAAAIMPLIGVGVLYLTKER